MFGHKSCGTKLAELHDALRTAQSDLRALRHDLDDLDDAFRRWRGKEAKTRALDTAGESPKVDERDTQERIAAAFRRIGVKP